MAPSHTASQTAYSQFVTETASAPVIVVADDEEDILELVALGLERAGYVVHRAVDGEQALALMREHRPNVAILDVAMPKLDGFELTRRLRNDPATSEIKIVLLTARVQEADVDAGLAAGAHDYVTKPFSPQELQERVAVLLQRPAPTI
jgi:DNA-binding response OmpR family regulator